MLGSLVRIERVRTESMIRIIRDVRRGVSIVYQKPITPLIAGLSFLIKHHQDGVRSNSRIKVPPLVLGGLGRPIHVGWMS